MNIQKGQKYRHVKRMYNVEIIEFFDKVKYSFEVPQVLMKLIDLAGNYYARCPIDEFENEYIMLVGDSRRK